MHTDADMCVCVCACLRMCVYVSQDSRSLLILAISKLELRTHRDTSMIGLGLERVGMTMALVRTLKMVRVTCTIYLVAIAGVSKKVTVLERTRMRPLRSKMISRTLFSPMQHVRTNRKSGFNRRCVSTGLSSHVLRIIPYHWLVKNSIHMCPLQVHVRNAVLFSWRFFTKRGVGQNTVVETYYSSN